ncbi:hypothetical protein IFM53868_07410 [Aspergillus udagawae]|uniref:Uncharacterized protein n=1 Tax=Aspergillus udagawae TaxID=91492 RepID=A0ABQ1B5B1_9EURO|nr:hypothetical protein IFM53868_07410 [Aspergillus udagawae]GFG16060.1 hypothetical protein IFM5058_07768 [Aspergillus udagawae]
MQLSKAIIFSFLALQTTYALPVANPDPQTLQEICCSLLDEIAAAASAATTAALEAAELQLQMTTAGNSKRLEYHNSSGAAVGLLKGDIVAEVAVKGVGARGRYVSKQGT